MPEKTGLNKPQYPEFVIPESSAPGDIFGLKKTSDGKTTTQVPTPAAAKAVKA